MARTAWVLTDDIGSETIELEINPTTVNIPVVGKRFIYQVATEDSPSILDGGNDPLSMKVSGTILTKGQYETLRSWWLKGNEITITDEFGYEYLAYITSFMAKREKYSSQYPWRHSYDMDILILEITPDGA